MAIPEHIINEIKYRNDIEDVISPYVDLKRRGKNLLGLCPFHNEKTPSFTVYPENGEPYEHKFEKNNHMAEEIEYFANTILGNFENTVSTPESAAKTVELIETIIESADANGVSKEVK